MVKTPLRRRFALGSFSAGIAVAFVVTGLWFVTRPLSSHRASSAPTARYLGLLPRSADFVPIAVWDQDPNGGNVPAPDLNQAQAFKAMGVNTFVGIGDWPESFGADDGSLAAAVAEKMYVIAGGDPTSDTSAQSVASVLALIASVPGAKKYAIGYQWLDEPLCSESIAPQLADIQAEDPGRMVFANEGAWAADLPNNDEGSGACLAQSEANLIAPSIVSADDYALTDPWHDAECEAGNDFTGGTTDLDCLYLYGQEAANLRSLAGSAPVWVFVETGTDDLGLSAQNGGVGEELRATPTQVNSAAWLTLLSGANGIEWFCDAADDPDNGDNTYYDDCAFNTTINANLTYIDRNIEHYAPEITAPDLAGAVEVSSSNPAVPVVADVKDAGGVTYLMTEGDRIGSTTATYSLAGDDSGTATLVYDSDSKYDPKASEKGTVFPLSSTGSFHDSLSNYAVKIYKVTAG
jgi:hypothetical protein